jgi:hypothetical protein
LGTLASSACAVHCVVNAALPNVLSALGLGALLGHEAEWGFTALALAFAVSALVVGWRRHHSRLVVALLGGGMAALLLGRVLENAGEAVCLSLSLFGGAMLVAGHLSNIHASRRLLAARG